MHDLDSEASATGMDHNDSSLDSQTLASSLEPALRRACDGHLSPIEWFRSTWQRGGAATGRATWSAADGHTIPVVVKLPIGPVEYTWTSRLGLTPMEQWDHESSRGSPTPRVLACGDALGGYDLGWIVMERLDGPPIAQNLTPEGLDDMLRSAARFYVRAASHPLSEPPAQPEYDSLIARARHIVKESGFHESQRWNDSLKRAQKGLEKLLRTWSHRPIDTWCHGDLHPGNALHRVNPDGATCVLIDLSHIHPGHWVEDAVYLERLYWGKPEVLGGAKPLALMAKHRREQGLSTDSDYPSLACIRRVLSIVVVPLQVEIQGHPRYVSASLDRLEKSLDNLGL